MRTQQRSLACHSSIEGAIHLLATFLSGKRANTSLHDEEIAWRIAEDHDLMQEEEKARKKARRKNLAALQRAYVRLENDGAFFPRGFQKNLHARLLEHGYTVV